jgi:hypothetical protein
MSLSVLALITCNALRIMTRLDKLRRLLTKRNGLIVGKLFQHHPDLLSHFKGTSHRAFILPVVHVFVEMER